MNNNVHLQSARGYDGLPNLVMPNYWTPWQSQQAQKRKREEVPEMRKKRRMKGKADESESVNRNIVDQKKVPSNSKQADSVIPADRRSNVERSRVVPQVGTLKSHLREHMAESIKVFHRLGDNTRKPGSLQPPKENLGADFTQSLKAGSGSLMLPQNNKRGISKEDAEFEFQNHVKKRRPNICTAAPWSQTKVSARGEHGSSYWQSSACLPQNGCSQIKLDLEESTPILPWQREEREAMKKAAQREREQAARVTSMGIDYVNERLRYRK